MCSFRTSPERLSDVGCGAMSDYDPAQDIPSQPPPPEDGKQLAHQMVDQLYGIRKIMDYGVRVAVAILGLLIIIAVHIVTGGL